MEVYHVNAGGPGAFSLSVELPYTDTTVERWQTYEVHSIKTNATVDPEIIDFTSKGVTSGTLNLKMYKTNSTTGTVIIDQNITVPWNATAT